MSEFSGKRVLITGASRGIGRQLALDFAADGARVAVNYLSSRDAAEAVVDTITTGGGEAFAIGADIGRSDQVAGMFDDISDRLGGLDILINNAGLSRDVPFLDMTETEWDTVISTNLKGPFLCCQSAARMMLADGADGGAIVNISAVTSLVGRDNAANYSASKAGLNGLTRALAVELGPKVTVNGIALGFIDSPLVREVFTADQIADVEGKLPTGRMGRFDEVVALVRYLASEAGGFVTGQTISLDGGQIIRMP